jgi:hypothetical protein
MSTWTPLANVQIPFKGFWITGGVVEVEPPSPPPPPHPVREKMRKEKRMK